MKGLFFGGHSKAAEYITLLFGLFGDDHLASTAAKCLGDIVASDKTVSKKHHAVVKVSLLLWGFCPPLYAFPIDPCRSEVR
jgi:hypothetical protein